MVRIENLSKVFRTHVNEINALKGINIDISSSGLVFVLGKSGCGKSTLLNIIAGYEKPTSGIVSVGDYCGSEMTSNGYYANGYSMICQDYKLIEHFTVRQNMEIVCRIANKSYDIIPDVLDSVGIAEYIDNRIYELSGGECQRVAIALALCKDSNLILADEPTGNLDKKNSAIVFDMLKELSKQRLVIVVSHDISAATKYADRIITLKDGVVIGDECNEIESILSASVKEDSAVGMSHDDGVIISNNGLEGVEFNAKPLKIATKKDVCPQNLSGRQSASILLSAYRKRPVRYCLTILCIIMTLAISMTLAVTMVATNPVNVYNKITADGYDRYVYFDASYLSRDEQSGKLYNNESNIRHNIIVDGLVETVIDSNFIAQQDNIYSAVSNNIYIANADNNMSLTYLAGSTPINNEQVVISEYLARIIMRYGLLTNDSAKQFNQIGELIGERIAFEVSGVEYQIAGVFASFSSEIRAVFDIIDEKEFLKAIEDRRYITSNVAIDSKLNNIYIVKDNSRFNKTDGGVTDAEIFVTHIDGGDTIKIVTDYCREFLRQDKDSNVVISPLLLAMRFDQSGKFIMANKELSNFVIIFAVILSVLLLLTGVIIAYLCNMLDGDNAISYNILHRWGVSKQQIVLLRVLNVVAIVFGASLIAASLACAGALGTGAYMGYMSQIGCNLIW